MSPASRLKALAGVAACLWIGVLSAGVAAGQFKWLVGGDKNVKYKTFKDPAARFELEYPAKDWKLLPSGGSSLAVFARNDGPTLFINYVKMVDRLTAGEIDAMPDIEVSRLKEQQPKANAFKSEMLDSKAGRGVLIRYARGGGEPETAVQYSIPVGLDLYRLNGVIPDKQLAKYKPIVMHMIQSFTAPMASAAPKQ